MSNKILSKVIATIAIATASTQSIAEVGDWTIKPNIGVVVATDRDIIAAGSVTAAVSGTITWSTGETLSGVGSGEISVDAIDFDDMYDTPFSVGLDFENAYSDDVDLFGGIRYLTADAKAMQNVGSISASASITYTDAVGTSTTLAGSAVETIQAQLDDYESWTFKFGVNKYFDRNSELEKFIGGYIGYERVDEIKAKAKAVTADITTDKFKFYDDSDELALGLHAGFNKSLSVTKDAVFGLNVSADYHSELNDSDGDLDLVNLGAVNDAGDGVDLGVNAYIKIPF